MNDRATASKDMDKTTTTVVLIAELFVESTRTLDSI